MNDFNLENYMPQVLSPLPAVGTATSSNLQLCPSTDKSYYVRFKYKDNLKWTTLISEDYDVVKSTACKCFPDLINSEFEIQDLEGATIDSDFIATFLIISEKGVILNLVPKEDTSCTELFNRRTAENVADKITDSCGSPFSTFSKAYTHGQASCSTETLYSLPSSPSFSSFSTCTNFDEDDTPTIVTPPAKRLKTAVVSYHQITVQELKNYLLSHPGGKELITFYKANRTLDDPNRKKLVNIVVEHMLQYMPPNLLPSTGTKVEYAKAIVNLFPKLKDRNTPEGYEAFFDPVTKRGFLTTRLRNLFRDKPQRSSSHSEDQAIVEDVAFEDKIDILRKATQEEKDLIFKLTEETFTYRNRDRSKLASKYPRFQDTEGLISYEFSLMYPGKENNFVSSFISFLPVIQEVYKITVTSPNQNLLTNDDDDNDDWNEATKCLIIILHLLPPTSSKSARKTSVEKAVNKLLTFQDEQEPLNKIFIQKPSLQPFILGVGPAKSSIKRVYGVITLGSEVFCNRIPGLTSRQRDMCRSSPDAMVAVGDGIRLATTECKYQFRHHRWNCTGIDNPSSFGHVVIVGSREAAFTYAISSAGVAYAVTAACARGNISACGCAPGPKPREPAPSGWKWGGCSVDINFGMRFARKFMDARELEGDERSLMNLHNNKAGRKAVKMSLLTECKCHGVSGSCTMKTCWKTLPGFRQVGDNLMKKYYRARPVTTSPSAPGPRGIEHFRRPRKVHLVLKKGKMAIKKTPKKSDLVFLQMSPNYCERDLAAGSLGTVGRTCNRTSRGTDGCDLMCCGRGYNTHQYTRTWQCRCKFHWCCYVDCDTCSERTEEYTCK